MTPHPEPTRHVPIRSCVVCRRRAEKRELLRFRRNETGGWSLDPSGKAGGRGAWICRECAQRRPAKALRRAFRGHSDDIGAQLERYLDPVDEPQQPNQPTTHHGGMHG